MRGEILYGEILCGEMCGEILSIRYFILLQIRGLDKDSYILGIVTYFGV